jgi:hypothetical protein
MPARFHSIVRRLGDMALSALPPAPGLKGHLNFARRSRNDTCVDGAAATDAAAFLPVGEAAPCPRAFAYAETGAWADWLDRADVVNAAMERCKRNAQAKGGTCHPHAIGDPIVWATP